MIDDDARRRLHAEGRLLLRGPSWADEARVWMVEVAAALAAGRSWPQPIGLVSELSARHGTPYATHRTGAVPFHNDGVHLHQPARWLLLWCDTPAHQGGETLVARGADVRAALAPEVAAQLRERRFTVRVGDYRSCRPWLGPHPDDGDEVLAFFDPALADGAQIDAGADTAALLGSVRTAVTSVQPWCVAWRRGDLLVIDNLRTLHARNAYDGPRRMLRCLVGPWVGGGAS